MSKSLLSFSTLFSFSLLILFGIHLLILNLFDIRIDFPLLITSYIANFLLALAIIILIIRYINKLKSYIGFLFMAGSFIKFTVFFLWFYPVFKADGDMSTSEFAIFFVPYIICLIFETKKLSNLLNNL